MWTYIKLKAGVYFMCVSLWTNQELMAASYFAEQHCSRLLSFIKWQSHVALCPRARQWTKTCPPMCHRACECVYERVNATISVKWSARLEKRSLSVSPFTSKWNMMKVMETESSVTSDRQGCCITLSSGVCLTELPAVVGFHDSAITPDANFYFIIIVFTVKMKSCRS